MLSIFNEYDYLQALYEVFWNEYIKASFIIATQI